MKNVSLVSVFLFCLFSAVISEKLPLVDCETSKGPLRIEVHRDWAPLGADRFVELVQDDFFTDIAFFRCVKRFLTQFGISDNPDKKHWHNKNIPDDPNLNLGIQKNYVSFAGGGPNTRSTQIFIAFEYLDFLGKEPWETPFGEVIEGQSTLDGLYKGYGDIPPFGKGVDQQQIHVQGNKYVRNNFPLTDFIYSCKMVLSDEEQPVSEEVTEVVAVSEEQEKVEGEGNVAEGTESDTQRETNRRLRTKMSIRTKDLKQEVVGGEGKEEGGDLLKERGGVRDETVIFRAIGFLVVVVVLLGVYLRYIKPANSAGKAQ